ncbi:hypothetical protein EKO23_17325 [Nocardioides guangzhouensis]|uniref:Uncharacterized protein n=1 Tax=Nocardioides guangzhouensis TaxID=2497878 RepID=A0A4Q4Z848_9ACTN|nr:hypothetical protein [Nocardioides guangzhouensis]RYP84040.1 hypothetical protein EKO23_17325 [Nocardioides guangzhouensis]
MSVTSAPRGTVGFLERHRVTGAVLAVLLLVLLGVTSGALLAELLVELVHLAAAAVASSG